MPCRPAQWRVRLVLLAASAALAHAQLPAIYGEIAGAVWVVRELPPVVEAWRGIGLIDVHDYGHSGPGAAGQPATHCVTGRLGRFTVNLVQADPADSVFGDFLKRHGNGVFAILHAAPDRAAVESEIARLGALGVGVLRKLNACGSQLTFFDTEPQGKYVLGLVLNPQAEAAMGPVLVTHLGLVIRQAAPVSAYWQRLGFPAMGLADAGPREDSRYHGRPLWLSFGVGWHRYSQPTLEWIVPPRDPPNCYADFLKAHGEGVQHLGMPVDDLETAIARYAKLGYAPAQSGAWGNVGKPGSGRYAYMDTEALGGFNVELIHAVR